MLLALFISSLSTYTDTMCQHTGVLLYEAFCCNWEKKKDCSWKGNKYASSHLHILHTCYNEALSAKIKDTLSSVIKRNENMYSFRTKLSATDSITAPRPTAKANNGNVQWIPPPSLYNEWIHVCLQVLRHSISGDGRVLNATLHSDSQWQMAPVSAHPWADVTLTHISRWCAVTRFKTSLLLPCSKEGEVTKTMREPRTPKNIWSWSQKETREVTSEDTRPCKWTGSYIEPLYSTCMVSNHQPSDY